MDLKHDFSKENICKISLERREGLGVECAREPVIVWHDGMNGHGVLRLGWLSKSQTIGFKAFFIIKILEKNVLGKTRGAKRCCVPSIVCQSGVN